ncbi:MAG: NTP transferase domain-containing protein [bacterium]|nr:NTP transferase domain-containing protein [bacterium]
MTASWPEVGPPRLVVLAAGASSRLGQPKALVALPGGTPLDRILAAWPYQHSPAWVVTGAHHSEISQSALRDHPQHRIIHNPRWALGRTGSLQVAIGQLPGQDILMAPVDCPRPPRRVFEALVERWSAAGSPAMGWCAPFLFEAATGKNCYGHPILIGRGLLARALQMSPDKPLRWLRKDAQPLLGTQVQDQEILEDLDAPEDLKELVGRDRQST